MLTQKGLNKIANGGLEKSFIEGRLKFIIKTYKVPWWKIPSHNLIVEYQLLDIDTNELLCNEFFKFNFVMGDTLAIELPNIKKKVKLSAS